MRTIFLLVVLAAGLFGLGNAGGRAFVARQGNTGAPGDNRDVCQSCHNSATIQVLTAIEVKNRNGDVVDSYVPGQTYDVTVKVNPQRGTPSGYGFQMVALNAPLGENGDPINSWIDSATNVKLVQLNNGRRYAEHDGVSRSNEFKVKWVAPDQGTGPVSFYAAGNGVNFNGGTSGDGADTTRIQLAEAPPVAVREVLDLAGVFIGPNPVSSFLSIDRTDRSEENWTVRMFTITGQRVLERRMPAGVSQLEVLVGDLAPGLYLLQLSDGRLQQTVRLIKQ